MLGRLGWETEKRCSAQRVLSRTCRDPLTAVEEWRHGKGLSNSSLKKLRGLLFDNGALTSSPPVWFWSPTLTVVEDFMIPPPPPPSSIPITTKRQYYYMQASDIFINWTTTSHTYRLKFYNSVVRQIYESAFCIPNSLSLTSGLLLYNYAQFDIFTCCQNQNRFTKSNEVLFHLAR